jgi:predicted transcriptional regulator
VQPHGRGNPKRPQSALSALSARFTAFVQHHPGLRIEQINKQLGTTTKDLALPIRKLLAEGTIMTKNKKRSTTYFPGKAATRA